MRNLENQDNTDTKDIIDLLGYAVFLQFGTTGRVIPPIFRDFVRIRLTSEWLKVEIETTPF